MIHHYKSAGNARNWSEQPEAKSCPGGEINLTSTPNFKILINLPRTCCICKLSVGLLTTKSLGRFSLLLLVFGVTLDDSFRLSILSVRTAICCCSCNNCVGISWSQVERESGMFAGVVTVAFGVQRELFRGEILGEVSSILSVSFVRFKSSSRRLVWCCLRTSSRFLVIKMFGRSCPWGTVA